MLKLLFAFILLCNLAVAQSRLGYTSQAIKNEFAGKYEMKYGYDKDGEYYIEIKDEPSCIVRYFFNEQFVCYMTGLIPRTQGDLNAIVEKYNSRYVIISQTQWKMYSINGIVNIELRLDTDLPVIMWTLAE